MKITALVENRSANSLKPAHGLSLYIETKQHALLFDLGPDDTLFQNAEALKIDLAKVDTVILSHGHNDHGGALRRFLDVNHTARVYVQREAFEPHFSKLLWMKGPIGLDAALASHPQIVCLDGNFSIDGELSLFTVPKADKCRSSANDRLLCSGGPDTFSHEQNLIIRENATALIMGCGHTGVVNILNAASCIPQVCVGGFHLFNPFTKRTVSLSLLDEIAQELRRYPDTAFYTCHCTGMKAYEALSQKLPGLRYLACGDTFAV